MDVKWGYNEVLIKEEDRWKAAFITNEGLFKPTVMFFSLTNSPATFQTMMNTIFQDLINGGNVTIYMDDIAIHTGCKEEETEDEHVARHCLLVRQVLNRLCKNDLHLNLEKCTFKQDHLNFLGVRVAKGVVEMEQAKVDKVKTWTRPCSECTRSPKVLGVHGLLPTLYQRLLEDSTTPPRPHKAGHTMALGRPPATGL